MRLQNKLLILAMILFIAVGSTPITSYARQARSQAAKNDFKALYPCPSNGKSRGSCLGYVIDHKTPLACSGNDAPSNMQWQSVADAKAKDKWERKGCQRGSSKNHSYSRKSYYSGGSSSTSSSNGYSRGARGGCFTYSANGKKHYVDRSFC